MKIFSLLVIFGIYTFIPGTALKASAVSLNYESVKDSVQGGINISQAKMMLNFLESINNKKPLGNKIEQIMSEEGTELIIRQMNLVRKVTKDQYKLVLLGLCMGQLPVIAPADSSEKAVRGLSGLKRDVWGVLNWGLKHTDLLKERLALLENSNVYEEAKSLALANLPEKVDMNPKLFFVMGGRAGAAALRGDRIYYDPLLVSFLCSLKNQPFSDRQEIIDYFAHEMHHIGFGKIIEKNSDSLHLSGKNILLYDALLSILSEGSATYLVSGHRNLEKVFSMHDLTGEQKHTDQMLSDMGKILVQIQKGEIADEESYDKAISGLFSIGFHAMGSVMLNAIDKTAGFNTVMEVLKDPRRLLAEYNKAADIFISQGTKLYKFDENLAAETAILKN